VEDFGIGDFLRLCDGGWWMNSRRYGVLYSKYASMGMTVTVVNYFWATTIVNYCRFFKPER